MLRVMLVDNHLERTAPLKQSLTEAGCEVIAHLSDTANLDEAVSRLQPDIVIIDTDSPSRDTLEHLIVMSQNAPRPIVMCTHADDMQRRGIGNGDLVRVSNKRGQLVLRAQASEQLQPAQTFIPMHWGAQYMAGNGVNALMPGAYDKVSRQPELKHAAVKLEKLELPWRMTVIRSGNGLQLLQKVRPLLRHFTYATCGLFGREPGFMILRAAHDAAPDPDLIAELDQLLGMTADQPMLHYDDARRGISKRILVEDRQVTGVRLTGEILATDWLKEVMTQGQLTDELRRWALAPLSAPPTGQRSRGKVVCNCLDVAENEIIDNIRIGADLVTLQNKLKCGTQCGSCVPELKQLVARHHRKTKSQEN